MNIGEIFEGMAKLADLFLSWAELKSLNLEGVSVILVLLIVSGFLLKILFFSGYRNMIDSKNKITTTTTTTTGPNSPITIKKGGDIGYLVFFFIFIILILIFIYILTQRDEVSSSPSVSDASKTLTKDGFVNIPEMIVTVSGVSAEDKGKASVFIERLSNSQLPLFEGHQPVYNSTRDFYYFSNLKGKYNEKVKITVSLKGYRTVSKDEVISKSVSFSLKRSL